MDIELLTKEQIFFIHNEAIINFGGEPGFDNSTYGKIESILDQQFSHFGYEKYPSIFDKAAMLLYFFAKDHCFKDGNKRVALYAVVVFLDINGYETTFDNDEAELVTYAAAQDKSKGIIVDQYIDKLSNWLYSQTIKK
ncbi:MAG: type II toxin-antitoxin system death-on-curing family toxin [Clostridiaceae bacterium]